MPVTTKIGLRQYDIQKSRLIPNVAPKIMLIDDNPNDAGFLAFFNRCRKQRTSREKFDWDVDNWRPVTDQPSAAVTAAADVVPVNNVKYFNKNEMWVNKRTGEVFQVTAVNTASGNLDVIRAVTALESAGGTAAAAMLATDTLVLLSPVVGEDSRRQTTLTTVPSTQTNYTQQFRWELGLSRRQIKREFETDDELPFQTMKILQEARMGLNRQFLAGETGAWTQDGQFYTTTKGMKNVPTTYTLSVGGVLYETNFDDFLLNKGFKRGSRNKMCFASNAFILAILEMAKERVVYDVPLAPRSNGVGISVMEYHAGNGGRLMIVEDRHLTDAWDGTAILCDMGKIKCRVFSRNGYNDDLHIMQNTQDPDDLGQQITLFGDMGLEWGPEECHALITDVSGGSKGRAIQ